MTSKGKQYSTIVRRAGLAWGKGDLRKAIAVLEEGIACATQNGDAEVARVLQRDLERYQRAAAGEGAPLSWRPSAVADAGNGGTLNCAPSADAVAGEELDLSR